MYEHLDRVASLQRGAERIGRLLQRKVVGDERLQVDEARRDEVHRRPVEVAVPAAKWRPNSFVVLCAFGWEAGGTTAARFRA